MWEEKKKKKRKRYEHLNNVIMVIKFNIKCPPVWTSYNFNTLLAKMQSEDIEEKFTNFDLHVYI